MPSADAPDSTLAILAARIAMDLPVACEKGVRESLTVLDQHWAKLRQALDAS